MKIEKTECSYQVTECDLKFGEQIALDGELLIPASVFDKIVAEIEGRKEKEYLCFDDNDMDIYITGLNDAIDIIDKYKTKSKDIEMQATEFLAEARACAE